MKKIVSFFIVFTIFASVFAFPASAVAVSKSDFDDLFNGGNSDPFVNFYRNVLGIPSTSKIVFGNTTPNDVNNHVMHYFVEFQGFEKAELYDDPNDSEIRYWDSMIQTDLHPEYAIKFFDANGNSKPITIITHTISVFNDTDSSYNISDSTTTYSNVSSYFLAPETARQRFRVLTRSDWDESSSILPYDIFNIEVIPELKGTVNTDNLPSVALNISLTDDFIEKSSCSLVDFIVYISFSDPYKTSLSASHSNSCYQYLSYGWNVSPFKNQFVQAEGDKPVTNSDTYMTIYQKSYYPGFQLSKSDSSTTVLIHLNEIGGRNRLTENMYLCVYANINEGTRNVGSSSNHAFENYHDPQDFSSADNELYKAYAQNNGGSVSIDGGGVHGISLYKSDDGLNFFAPSDSGYYPVKQMYVSDAFKFSSLPAYTGLTDRDGNKKIDTDHGLDDYIDPDSGLVTPDKYKSSTDMSKTEMDFDQFMKYYNDQRQKNNLFNGTNLNSSDIFSVFNTEGNFFKFMTAFLTILPTTFMTVFVSFMFITLAISVFKFLR